MIVDTLPEDDFAASSLSDTQQVNEPKKKTKSKTSFIQAQDQSHKRTIEAQELARLVSMQLGRPEPDQRSRFRLTRFQTFVERIQAVIRSTEVDPEHVLGELSTTAMF
jgi:hypothetical protein